MTTNTSRLPKSRVLAFVVLWMILLSWCVIDAGDALAADPDDPLFRSRGSWGQSYDDQWALKRIGFGSEDGESAWDLIDGELQPVTVAVIDTGLDYMHPDFDRDRVWRNPNETQNGKDDDNNGYVDDVIGWDFVDQENNPFDQAGHGTHVAGLIAAASGNGVGIAGINPAARIMPLKALNFIGRGFGASIAEAIFYAVKNGARVINLSLGTEELTEVERAAVLFANAAGVVVVVASGNTSSDTSNFGLASLDGVIVVGATDADDNRAPFSNWGADMKIAAPGIEVLSLRALRTDFMLVAGTENYEAGDAFVGDDGAYYWASGTSFSAPLVSGVASLLFSMNPDLTATQVTRMILQSARDIEFPGVDQFTGYGLLDARAAVIADPEFYVEARIAGVRAAESESGTVAEVLGTADANAFDAAWIELGQGEDPSEWTKVTDDLTAPVVDGVVGAIPVDAFAGSNIWIIRVITEHENGRQREARFKLTLG